MLLARPYGVEPTVLHVEPMVLHERAVPELGYKGVAASATRNKRGHLVLAPVAENSDCAVCARLVAILLGLGPGVGSDAALVV